MGSLALSFNDVNFSPIQQDGQIWLTGSELSQALGYAKTNAVTQIFERNSDEFAENMTQTISNPQNLNLRLRIFSLRGCHLVAMFSKTDIAKQFRKWVLDIIDTHIGQPVPKTHKSERTPLHEAHALLMTKTKHLNSSEAWKLINQRFGTNSIEEIPYDAIPVAVEYVHHLIALYSAAERKQASQSFCDDKSYELVRKLAENILSQNSMMQDVWKALKLINKHDMLYYSRYVVNSNVVAKEVSHHFDFKNKAGLPLVDENCRMVNLYGGCSIGTNPNWFNYPA